MDIGGYIEGETDQHKVQLSFERIAYHLFIVELCV